VRVCACVRISVCGIIFFFSLQFPGLCFWKDVEVITVLCTELSFVLKKFTLSINVIILCTDLGSWPCFAGGDDPHLRADEWGPEADSCTCLCTGKSGGLSGHDVTKAGS